MYRECISLFHGNRNNTIPEISCWKVFVHVIYFAAISGLLLVRLHCLMDCIHVTVRNSKCYNVAEITFCTKASSKSGVQQLHVYQLDWNWDSNRYSDWYRNGNKCRTRWPYYVECPQYSTRLEAFRCLCDGHVQQVVKVICHKVHRCRRRMVPCYLTGDSNVSSHEGTLAPPGEYDWTSTSFGPLESTTKTANGSVQPFLHSLRHRVSDSTSQISYRPVMLKHSTGIYKLTLNYNNNPNPTNPNLNHNSKP